MAKKANFSWNFDLCFAAKNHFLSEMAKRVQMGPKGSQIVKNTLVGHFGPLWNVDKPAIFGQKWTFSPLMNGGTQSKKKGS